MSSMETAIDGLVRYLPHFRSHLFNTFLHLSSVKPSSFLAARPALHWPADRQCHCFTLFLTVLLYCL